MLPWWTVVHVGQVLDWLVTVFCFFGFVYWVAWGLSLVFSAWVFGDAEADDVGERLNAEDSEFLQLLYANTRNRDLRPTVRSLNEFILQRAKKHPHFVAQCSGVVDLDAQWSASWSSFDKGAFVLQCFGEHVGRSKLSEAAALELQRTLLGGGRWYLEYGGELEHSVWSQRVFHTVPVCLEQRGHSAFVAGGSS